MPGRAATVAADRFGITGSNGLAKNDLDSFQLDLERTFEDGRFLTSVQFGGRAEQMKFVSSGSRNTSLSADPEHHPGHGLAAGLRQDFFEGKASGATSNWMGVDVNQILAAITPVNTNPRLGDQSERSSRPSSPSAPRRVPDAVRPGEQLLRDGNYWNNNFSNETMSTRPICWPSSRPRC